MTSNRALDITGEVYGKLTAISRTSNKNNNGCYIWLFKCSCGEEVLRDIGNLRFRRDCACCKSCKLKAISARTTTHGMSQKGNKTYKSWSKIKERCFNKNDQDYYNYGALGIIMCDEWRNDFKAFYDHIGDPPDANRRYSVDRIENELGYVPGNVRWATDSQQARNKARSKVNKTGVTGVHWDTKTWPSGNRSTVYAKAVWTDDVKQYSKCFNTEKYGKDVAFNMACEYREMMIAKLNAEGAGYSPNHGKDKVARQETL